MKEHVINAEGKILGRLASEIAVLLRGKDAADFAPNRAAGRKITVFHTDRMRVTGRKLDQKMYRRHSGYLGNLKEERLKDVMARDSRNALRHAVAGMLPKNRLRRQFLKNLILVKAGR
ncbi:MAG: 50S ribosomal protein L13 [Patescibacteria group bacterium]